jgi:predicted enzyme related to lactoylglutathione lyase
MGRKATMELVLDCRDPEHLAEFWREALGYRGHYADAALVVLVPEEGSASPLLLQRVPEPKAVKNRMHLDVVVEDVESEVRRLEGLGARRIDHDVQSFGETRWVRLLDPEQNEFCVSTGIEW